MLDERSAPYLEALEAFAARDPARLHVPGHKGGPGADPGLVAGIGARALALDIPALIHGVDIGVSPTPFEAAQQLAARAWGSKRAWFLINGASQGNHAAGLTVAHLGKRVVVQRNVHSSTIDALILAGLRPTFAAPELDRDLGIAHCLTPAALERALEETPGAAGAWVVSPTYFGAVADIEQLAAVAHARDVPLIVDESWGAHLAFHPDLPAHALSLGADLALASTHKIVGSLGQSAILHLGHGDLIPAEAVDRSVTLVESTSPSALLCASLDASRRQAVVHGRELLGRTIGVLASTRERIRALPGLNVLDERLIGRPGVHDFDPLRLTVDLRGLNATGYHLADMLREIGDINLELAAAQVIMAVFGLGEPPEQECDRLVDALTQAVERTGPAAGGAQRHFSPPPPWGELVMTPREAYLGPQETVPAREAAGRIAAESLATYPPGIPNVLPGERLTEDTLDYIATTLAGGGSLRGASDRLLQTVRVVYEATDSAS
jgi:lysine decarboxylase